MPNYKARGGIIFTGFFSSHSVNADGMTGFAQGYQATTVTDVDIKIPFEWRYEGITVNVVSNSKNAVTEIGLIDDTAKVGTIASITASTSGKFESLNQNIIIQKDSICCFSNDTGASASGSIGVAIMLIYGT